MKIRSLFYIVFMYVFVSSFFSCELPQEQKEIQESVIEMPPIEEPNLQELTTEDTKLFYWKIFCPETTFKGYNASGSYSCIGLQAYVSAVAGGGELTFNMTGGTAYWVFGNLYKQNNFGGGSFTTPHGSVKADSYDKPVPINMGWFYGNCSLSGDASAMGGGTRLENLIFLRLERYQAPDYDPEYWNDGNLSREWCYDGHPVLSTTRQDNNNCYNYACNRDAAYFQGDSSQAQPGKSAGREFINGDGDSIRDAAVADGLEYKGTTLPKSGPGKIVVAFFVGNEDFHWCRRDNNGYWSHKSGRFTEVTDLDYSGNRITDPQTADWWGMYEFYGYFLTDSGTTQGQGSESIKGVSYPCNICP
jgi:hypothetical protein